MNSTTTCCSGATVAQSPQRRRLRGEVPVTRRDYKPVITTDAVFKQIKDFVLALKESRTRKRIIFTAAGLREAIGNKRGKTASGAASPGTLTDSQVLTAVKNLSSQGFVRLLTLSSGEERILLVPELMNNLAASMVLEARRNPRGLGAVEESRLFDNSYRFRELEELLRGMRYAVGPASGRATKPQA